MASYQLVQQIMNWKDEPVLSIFHKESVPTPGERNLINRYYLSTDDDSLYFTYREMEIAFLLAQSLTYKVIGRRLALSDRTVECHVRRMRLKLGSKDRFELIAYVASLDVMATFKKDYDLSDCTVSYL